MQCHKPGHRVPARCVSALLAAGALLATVADQVGATSGPAVRTAELAIPAAPAALAVPMALRLRSDLSATAPTTPVPEVRTALPAEAAHVTKTDARHQSTSRIQTTGRQQTAGRKQGTGRTRSYKHTSMHHSKTWRSHSNQWRFSAAESLKHLPQVNDPKAAKAIREALSLLGVPYLWGGTSRAGFDCSGFTQHVWAVAGVKIPRTVRAQARAGTPIPMNKAEPGDLVVFYPSRHHVGIYVGNGLVIDSPHTGAWVRPDPVRSMPVSVVVRVRA